MYIKICFYICRRARIWSPVSIRAQIPLSPEKENGSTKRGGHCLLVFRVAIVKHENGGLHYDDTKVRLLPCTTTG